MAPADPGGGWDTTARAMSKALADGKISKKASEVYNVPGGRDDRALPACLQAVGSVQPAHGDGARDARRDLDQRVSCGPLYSDAHRVAEDGARSDRGPLAVECKTLDDLVSDMKSAPAKDSFGGGSAGGTDQILVGLVSKAAGVDRSSPSTSPTRVAARRPRGSSRDPSTPASPASRSSQIRWRPARCGFSRCPPRSRSTWAASRPRPSRSRAST
jgi:hypothetical protein